MTTTPIQSSCQQVAKKHATNQLYTIVGTCWEMRPISADSRHRRTSRFLAFGKKCPAQALRPQRAARQRTWRRRNRQGMILP
eukprot:751095-Hanusia_phi.AAC.3